MSELEYFMDSFLDSFLMGIADLLSAAIPWLILAGVTSLAVAIVTYVFPCMVVRNMGRKAKLQKDWMPFVPIAQDVYAMDIVAMPRWRALFFGFTGNVLIGLIMYLLFNLAVRNGHGWIIFAAVLYAIWLTMAVLTTYKFNYLLFKGFGYNPSLALLVFLPGTGPIAAFVLKVMFAFNNRIAFGNSVPPAQMHQAPTPPPPPPPQPQQAASGTITGLSGAYGGATFTMRKGDVITMGRDPKQCNLVFDQLKAKISGKHCEITFDGSFYYVTDYSSNGTYLDNGKRLSPKQTELLPKGSVIYLAEQTERFRLS